MRVKIPAMNAPPAEREASGSPLEGGQDNYLDHLKPKSETRSTKQIRMKKIPMTKTVTSLTVTKRFNPLLLSAFVLLLSPF